MQFFFVGLAMRSCEHDYAEVHAALFAMNARRVSVRIWLCVVQAEVSNDVFSTLGRSLSAADEMLIVEVPERLRGPRLVALAA